MANSLSLGSLALCLVLFQVQSRAQSPGFVQQNYAAPQSPRASVTVAYPAAQTAGDANILAIGWNDTFASIKSVTDSAGNTYQLAVPTLQTNGLSQAIYYALNVQGRSNVVTVSFNQPAAFADVRITEYSGLSTANAFEAGTSAAGYGSNADSGPVSLSTVNDLVFGAGMTATAFTSSAGEFSLRTITSPDGDIVEDEVAGAAGLYDALATLNDGAWLMQVAAFRPAAPAGAPALSVSLTATNTLLLSWPAAQTGFTLQGNADLGSLNWPAVTGSATVVGDQYQVVVPLLGNQQFFRLWSP